MNYSLNSVTQDNLFCRILADAQNTNTAVAAINILNHNTARAVVQAAEVVSRPVILQPSTATVHHYGPKALYDLLSSVRAFADVPVAIHLDHCADEALAKTCIEVGWDSVMMDYSALPFDKNVAFTRRMVEYAHSRGVAVEGEIGVISGVEDDIAHENTCLATFEETVDFIVQTGVDAIAPAIGTAHGFYNGVPKLNFKLVEQLGRKYAPVVVHGGTGLPENDFIKLITCGAAKINISTALKQVYLATARKALQDNTVTPVDFDKKVETFCSSAMENFIRLFAKEEVKVYVSELSG
jgi:fructose-bisphosphate aldolase class II